MKGSPEVSSYDGLFGNDFLRRALENRDGSVLEAIWRLRQPAAAQAVVEPLASLGLPRLSDLLLEEVLERSLGDQVASDIQSAVRQHNPPLTTQGIERLADWLRDNEPQEGTPTTAREALEVWLLQQEGPNPDSFAVDALTGELGYEVGAGCRQAALDRCREDPAVAQRVSTKLEAALAEDADTEAWERAADFVGVMAADRRPPQYLVHLTDRLVDSAAELAPSDEFPQDLRKAIIAMSAPLLKKLFTAASLADTPGSRALVRLHGDLKRPQERAKAFIEILHRQPRIWGTIGNAVIQSWDADEWERRLASVRRSDLTLEDNLIVGFLNAAPAEHAALVVQIAVGRADEPDHELVSTAGAKLANFMSAPAQAADHSSEVEPATEVPWWPSGESPARLQVFDAVLKEAIPDSDDRLSHIVAAVGGEHLSPAEASYLIPSDEFSAAVKSLAPGSFRGDLVNALAERDADPLIEAIRAIHSDAGFQLDLAESVAARSPETAFIGAANAYPGLSEVDRGRIVTLLESHGGPGEVPALDAIVQDTRAANTEYRRRAALRIGEITPEGDSLPPSVIELLRSNRPELVDAGATVIGRVKPEDPTLIRMLRSVAIESEEESAARSALTSLAETFVGRLTPTVTKDERAHLLGLLAAVGTPDVVDSLLAHVGREALDDDPELRRAAASGLKEVASQGSLDSDQLARLVRVIEEERDPDAKEDLQAAVTRASLGEDAALEVLQELLPHPPKHDLRDLLGAERNRVVRHLQLLVTEQERGEQGRPGVIMQLDIIAERLLRVAYLRHGQSEPLKTEIRSSPKTPDYGALIQALSGVKGLQRIQGRLQTLHALRSEKTEFTHTGDQPTEEDETTAWSCFSESAKIMVNLLDQD